MMAEPSSKIRIVQETGFLLLACVLIFSVSYFGGIGVRPFFIIQLLVSALVVLTVAMTFLRPRLCIPVSSHSILLVLFVALVFYSRFAAGYPYPAEKGFLFYVNVFFFYCACRVLLTPDSFIRLCRAAVVLVAGFAFYGIIAYASNDYMLWGIMKSFYRNRLTGTFINPNHFGALLSMAIPVGVYFIFSTRNRMRIFFCGAFLLMMVALGLTFSISSYLGLIAGIGLIFFMVRQADFFARAPFLRRLIVLSLIVSAVVAFFILRLKEYSFYTHWVIGISTIEHIARAMTQQTGLFLLGYGFGSYRFIATHFYPQLTMLFADHAHNEYLEMFIELGLTGFLCFVFFWLAVFRFGFVAYSRELNEDRKLLIACLCGAVFSSAVHMAFDFNFHIPAVALVCIFFVAGLDLLHALPAQPKKKAFVAPVVVYCAIAVLLSVNIYSTRKGFRNYLAESRIEKIINTRTGARFTEVEPAVDQALSLAPGNADLAAYTAEAYFYFAFNTDEPGKQAYYYHRAEQLFLRAIRLNSAESLLHARLADLYAARDFPVKAFAFYDQAVRAAPMHVVPYIKRIGYSLSLPEPDYAFVHSDVRFVLNQMHPFLFQNIHDQRQFFTYVNHLLSQHRQNPLIDKLYVEVARLIPE
jgi:O-antigen ligase